MAEIMQEVHPQRKDEKQTQAMMFDDVLSLIGFGRWSLFMFAAYVIWATFIGYFSLAGAFVNPPVDHWCHVTQLDKVNWTLEQKLNVSIPWVVRSGKLVRDQCQQYERDYDHLAAEPWSAGMVPTEEEAAGLPKRPCDRWSYDTSVFASTVTMQWNLVCSNAAWSSTFESFFFTGIAFGEPLSGYLSDRFGRRWMARVGAVTFLLVASLSSLSPWLSLVLAARFILGITHAVGTGVVFVLGIEACPLRYRAIAGLLVEVIHALTGMAFGAVGYGIREWRYLQLACCVPSLFLVALLPFLHESPRWQYTKGMSEEATTTLQTAARWHGSPLPPREVLLNITADASQVQGSDRTRSSALPEKGKLSSACSRLKSALLRNVRAAFVFVKTPVMRRITLIMICIWFSTGVVYWGIALSGTIFSNDPFLYMTLSAVMEVPGYTCFIPFVARWGRRRVLVVNFALSGLAILATLLTPEGNGWATFTLALFARFFISGVYGILYLCASELFPTTIRTRGLCFSSTMARLGSILSPFIVKNLANTYNWAPSLVFGITAGLGSAATVFLPESKGMPLVESVEELEALYSHGGNRYK